MTTGKLPKLIADVSHDLRTPLATIKLLNQVMKKKHTEKKYDDFDRQFDVIDTKINEMTTIIDTLIAKITHGEK